MRYTGLVVGLGNPGTKYDKTRHNMGFMFVDALLELAAKDGAVTEKNGKKFNSLLWAINMPQLPGEWLVAKPLTFMNDSGRAVQPLLAWHELAPDKLVVAQDEMDIPAGELRFKFGGGLAGHNGLASIAQHLGSKDFFRIRIGIGKALHKEDTLAWVLGRPAPDEAKKISLALPLALETLFVFAGQGVAMAVQFAHKAGKDILNSL